MSAEVAFALIGVTIVVLALFTYAAMKYVPMVLGEETHEEEPPRSSLPAGTDTTDENFAD